MYEGKFVLAKLNKKKKDRNISEIMRNVHSYDTRIHVFVRNLQQKG